MVSRRVGSGDTKHRTVLNLGAGFSFPRELWGELTDCLEHLLNGESFLFQPKPEVLQEAQRIFVEISRRGDLSLLKGKGKTPLNGYYLEDIGSKHQRTVGVEYVSLHAANELHLPEAFSSLGFDEEQIRLLLAVIIGRMAHPGSEASTFRWLQQTSALGDLIGIDFNNRSVMSLHRACDDLTANHDAIEDLIYNNLSKKVDYNTTIALYDLTNTYFEGSPDDDEAKRGFSKEKRSDCLLKTLAVMIDWTGYIRKSRIFPGNKAECTTLDPMVEAMNPPSGTMFIMDRGIATEANVAWLVEHRFRYLVVNRETAREFEASLGKPLKTAGGDEILVYSQLTDDGKERRLLCYSPKRACKEKAMLEGRMAKYEGALKKLNDNLTNPRCKNDLVSVNQRLGKLAKEYSGVSQYYTVTVQDSRFTEKLTDIKLVKVIRIDYERNDKTGNKLTHPGVYSIKTNDLSLSDEEIWRTYIRLTTLESVFRCLKSELGVRPVFHQIKRRINAHLFVSTLAYQCVHTITQLLAGKGINDSWTTIVKTLQSHIRETIYIKSDDKPMLERRITADPELWHLRIYNALNLDPKVGKDVKKLL
jgi:transposase